MFPDDHAHTHLEERQLHWYYVLHPPDASNVIAGGDNLASTHARSCPTLPTETVSCSMVQVDMVEISGTKHLSVLRELRTE